jgi:hypothetical protein
LDRLRNAVARSSNGAITLAGHRGVGKTTAIRNVAAGALGDSAQGPPLAVIASAPARYDARDFVLYLHALLCREVIARTVDRELDGFVAAGAGTLVLAATTGLDGYDARPELDEAAWRTLFANLDRIAEHARQRGVGPALHPHVGTVVENRGG